jgi:ABC-type multidrug transport system fused ATPase/permease subunit
MDTVKRLYPYVRPYRRQILIAFAGMCVFTVFSVLPPLLIRQLVDRVIAPRDWGLLPMMVSAIVLVPVVAAAIRFFNMQVLILTSRKFLADMRISMYEKVMALSMRYHSGASSGMIVGRIMDDVNRLRRLLTGETVRMLVDMIVFLFSLSVAFALSWKLALILCAVIVVYVSIYGYFARWIRLATLSSREMYDQVAGRLQETIAGVRAVRIYNREEWETSLFLDRTAQGLDKALSSTMGSVTLSTICTGIAGYGSTIIAGLGAYFVLRHEMTYGDLHAFNSYVWMAIMPAVRLTTIAGQLSETLVSVGRILEILSQVPDIRSRPGAPVVRPDRGAVTFRNVHFAYEPAEPLYRGLSLDVEPGTTTALVGPTGCGKTTLTSLLMRFWDVQEGAVEIDGVDIRTVDLKSLRKLFGVVLQDPVVFEGTLAENIAYGCPGSPRERIEEAARAAEIHEMAMALPKGYDTVLGTQGVKLSVGEKQRVSIARAILKNPLILIMDEATSSLDSNSEYLIQRAMERLLRNRTSLVIAHRLSTITGARRIVVMENGRIVGTGTHRELMAIQGGLYRKLYEEMLGRDRERIR